MKRFRTLLITLTVLMPVITADAQWQRRTNLPTIYVNTFGNKAITSKTDYVYATLRYVDEQDQVTTYDSTQIRGRGNSTWNLRKKPYKLKFLEKQKFLGKGYAKTKKWTLLANAGDKTMMRNAVTSAMGEFTSLKFNPAYKFVDLVLNNVYMGTYQISDQVDVRPHRVDVVEQDLPLTDTSDISGGYLLEVDGFRDGNCFTTSRYGVPVRIHYPDDEDIVTSQTAYAQRYVKNFEDLLSSADFADAEKGYRPLVDSASLSDWYICTEVSANIDGFYSTYFYKDQQDPKLYWGPLWDYDIAYNNDYRMWNEQWLSTTAYSLMSNIGYGQARQWVNRMWEDPWFARLISQRYNQLLDSGLVDHLHATIDSLSALLDASQQLNYQKWGISTRMYHEVVIYSSYDQYVSDLHQFVDDHCAWLRDEFASKKPAEPTPPFSPAPYYYRLTNANTGKAIDLQNGKAVQYGNMEDRESEDWYIRETADHHFQLLNRSTGLALNDPTTGSVTATTNVGTQLNAVSPNEGDSRQQWDFLPQGTAGYYNLLNVYTQHIANLSGGSADDGALILSYTNDSRNGTSTNRLWFVIPTDTEVEEYFQGIRDMEPDAYALAYNPSAQTLHFGSETPALLSFVVSVHNAGGTLVGQFRADETFSVGTLSRGLYVVTWKVGGRQRSTKFMKP